MRNALMAAVAARAFANAVPRIEPQLTSVGKLALPERTSKRGSESKYPFGSLTEVGHAFGVKNKTAVQMSSIVSNANRKAKPVLGADGQPAYENKTLTAADGSTSEVPDTSKPITVHYITYEVTPEYRTANKAAFAKDGPFDGAQVLVFRDR